MSVSKASESKAAVSKALIVSLLVGLVAVACCPPVPPPTTVPAPPLPPAQQVAAGFTHTCAIVTGGAVRCWGSNEFGQLGDGTNSDSPGPVLVSGISGATQITAGHYHSCALLGGGSVRCWGANADGRLGDGTNTSSNTPVTVAGLTGVTQITANLDHTCALLADGTARCWGSNHDEALGTGDDLDSNVPVPVAGLSGATQVEAGGVHTCALVGTGDVTCWGNNGNGNLGTGLIGTGTSSNVPVDVVGVSGATQIAVGLYHSCALLGTGEVRCWGGNQYGALGDGSSVPWSPTPVDVSGLAGATLLTSGDFHLCAVVGAGAVRCWGWNQDGQLGDGTTTPSSNVPVDVVGLTDVARISSRADHTCVLVPAGAVKCWGFNNSGQLGDRSSVGSSNVPVDVV